MDFIKFKKLYKKYTSFPIPDHLWDRTEHEEYIHVFYSNKEFQDWAIKSSIRKAGINYKKYCCLDMAYYLIEDKLSKDKKEINYDSVITKRRKLYGLPIHDGGESYIRINFCPWCGKNLI